MKRIAAKLPPGLAYYKCTAVFTRDNVPAALLGTHKTKTGVWGLLCVRRGRVRYCLDGFMPETSVVEPGGTVAIEPEVPHHVELLDADSAFQIEFHRAGSAQ